MKGAELKEERIANISISLLYIRRFLSVLYLPFIFLLLCISSTVVPVCAKQ